MFPEACSCRCLPQTLDFITMKNNELIDLARILAEEHLEKEVCDSLMKDLIVSLEGTNVCIGKEFLHILTSKKIKPFNKESSKRVKTLAYNFGI